MFDWGIVLKLLLACFIGGLVGFSREKVKKAAGLRTHILVCMGATLFTIVSYNVAMQYPGADAGRIAAGVVLGIGFIGAGSILHSGKSIIGITTAASIWIAAAIGMSIGFGLIFEALIAGILSVIVLTVLHKIELTYFGKTFEED